VEKSPHCDTCGSRDTVVFCEELSEGGQSIPEKLALQSWKLGLFFSFLPSVQTNYEARWGYCIDICPILGMQARLQLTDRNSKLKRVSEASSTCKTW
jgi:hypothetical protein